MLLLDGVGRLDPVQLVGLVEQRLLRVADETSDVCGVLNVLGTASQVTESGIDPFARLRDRSLVLLLGGSLLAATTGSRREGDDDEHEGRQTAEHSRDIPRAFCSKRRHRIGGYAFPEAAPPSRTRPGRNTLARASRLGRRYARKPGEKSAVTRTFGADLGC